ncbi:TolC family protein [Aliiglaciecola sp. LCG003]|uniref:TolC family protein n=1 Tax=Aliiglaciecola sp. LCG003 TaxID=3053655 RepID=UPI002572363B|nr:TolC family protein [Aliiglaciecola sp. LCG003]WJG11310.1 TolC family protein [Aliiglaciecola sp. LCG003]
MFHLLKNRKLFLLLLLIWHSNLWAMQLSLEDVLDAAIEKHQQLNRLSLSSGSIDKPTNSWIASSPTVSLLYLHNQQTEGAKEAEISLNLPMKSSLQHDLEQQLHQSAPLIRHHASQQQALLLSGLIRFNIWEYQLQQVYSHQAQQKLKVLQTLLEHYQKLSKAGNTPSYLTMLVKQETIQIRIALLEYQNQVQKLLSEYRTLTGLNNLPDNIVEAFDGQDPNAATQHPDIQALDASWQLFTSQLKLSANNARPWNLSVTAKRIETSGITENQIGLGVEMPFSVGNDFSQSQYTEFVQAQSQYLLQRITLQQQIQQSINTASAELTLSQQRHNLLEEALEITQQLQPTLDNLLTSNIADQEWILRRSLEIVDTQAQFAVNQINLHRQVATLNQALGKSL